MNQTLNISIDLLKQRRNDKAAFEMLSCALLIKRAYKNSVLYLNVTHVMEILGVSYKKALKVIELMKTDPLFQYNQEKNCVYIGSVKGESFRTYHRRKKYIALVGDCVKVEISEDDSLRRVTCELRNKLLILAMRKKTSESLLVGDYGTAMEQTKSSALSLRKLGATFGMSKSSASRYVTGLVDTKRVGKSDIVAECVIENLDSKSESDWYKKHPKQKLAVWRNAHGAWSGWVVYGCVYSILNVVDSKSFQHIIFNHKGRVAPPATDSCCITPDGEGFWAKHQQNRQN